MTVHQPFGQRIAAARRKVVLGAAVAATLATQMSWAGVSSNTSGTDNTQNTPADNASGNLPAVTISLSGSTALRNFTTSPGMTLLQPGTSITLLNGPLGKTTTYTALDQNGSSVQLASNNFTQPDQPGGLTWGPTGAGTQSAPSTALNQVHSAIRLEWHEQGSVEGMLDLTNDQIGYTGGTPLVSSSTRNPVGAPGSPSGNPIWVNQNKWDGTNTANGHVLGSTSYNGFVLQNSDYNTYSNATYNAAGQNLQGGQNRVQMGISDVAAIQAFSIGGNSVGAMGATPLTNGYGKGNNNIGLNAQTGSLPSTTLATPGSFYQLRDQSVLNMPTTQADPQTGANYAAGAWNTGGVHNLDSRPVAATATFYDANPGTGLQRLNSGDAQWLSSQSRLANGAAFNMSTRDVGSGTRNVSALNVGLDPSFAVGKNDAGNSNDTTLGQNSQEQINIGGAQNTADASQTGALTAQLFSNKTAGSALRSTIQNNRMAIGTLGLSDSVPSNTNNSSTPLRALAFADTAGKGGGASYVLPSFQTITDGSYVISQFEQYVTVKAPDGSFATFTPQQWAAVTTGASVNAGANQTTAKGDNSNGDVTRVRDNVLNSTSSGVYPPNSPANPADQLLNKGFIIQELMQKTKTQDGINQLQTNPNYNDSLRTAFINNANLTVFNPDQPSSIAQGTAAIYGGAGTNVQSLSNNNQIAITSSNYLFGNFNQSGVRDYSAVQTALGAAKALYDSGSGADPNHGTNMFTGNGNTAGTGNDAVVNGSVANPIPASLAGMLGQRGKNGTPATGASKGDLIAMGDFLGHGAFNGADLYAIATGAALSDANGGPNGGFASGHLTSDSGADQGDQIRNGVLRKNAALDYMQTHTADATYTGNSPTNASGFLRQTAVRSSLAAANDPTGTNAFNKFDVNSDGNVNLNDVKVVDYFLGRDYSNLNHQLAATINSDGTRPSANPAPGSQIPYNLVMAKLYDSGDSAINPLTGTTQTEGTVIGLEDLKLAESQVGITFVPGDTNFDGKVDGTDVVSLLNNYGQTGHGVETGDLNGDGVVDGKDVVVLLNNFGTHVPAPTVAMLDALMTKADFSSSQEAAWNTELTSVPEPGTLGFMGVVAAGLLARRRRRA